MVYDKSCVAKLHNDAVDQTRRAELKHIRDLWPHGQLPQAKRGCFAELLEINLKTARAWAYKEQLVEL
jgi:hypothetical protein